MPKLAILITIVLQHDIAPVPAEGTSRVAANETFAPALMTITVTHELPAAPTRIVVLNIEKATVVGSPEAPVSYTKATKLHAPSFL